RFSRDWSSDVCSSDLAGTQPDGVPGSVRVAQPTDDGPAVTGGAARAARYVRPCRSPSPGRRTDGTGQVGATVPGPLPARAQRWRSEERRVGKDGMAGW